MAPSAFFSDSVDSRLAGIEETVFSASRADAVCVQRLGYGSAGFPAPGETLLTADGPPGGTIALSGHRKVQAGFSTCLLRILLAAACIQ